MFVLVILFFFQKTIVVNFENMNGRQQNYHDKRSNNPMSLLQVYYWISSIEVEHTITSQFILGMCDLKTTQCAGSIVYPLHIKK